MEDKLSPMDALILIDQGLASINANRAAHIQLAKALDTLKAVVIEHHNCGELNTEIARLNKIVQENAAARNGTEIVTDEAKPS